MLRQTTQDRPVRLGQRCRWGLGLVAACAILASLDRLIAATDGQPAPKPPAAKEKPRLDRDDNPLPSGALARLGTLRWRHGANVTYLAFTPDGKCVLTASQDNVLRLWDRKTGKEIRRFETKQNTNSKIGELRGGFGPGWGGPNMGQTSVALSPDGKTLVSTSMHSNTMHWWDVATGKTIRTSQTVFGLGGLIFSPDSKYLAGRATDQAIHVWQASTGKELRQIRRMQNQPGGLIFVGGVYGASSMAFSPNSKMLAAPESVFDNRQIRTSVVLWEVDTGKEGRRIDAGMGQPIYALAYAPDGKSLAYASNNGIRLCSADSGKEIRTIGPQQYGIMDLVFTPDGKSLAAKSQVHPSLRLYSVETGKLVRTLGTESVGRPNQAMFFGNGIRGRELAFSPDGKVLATAEGSTVRFWATDTGKNAVQTSGHHGEIIAVAVAADGKQVASMGADGTVRLWEATTGKERHQCNAPAGTTCGDFSPDARTIALGFNSSTVLLMDTATGKELRRFGGQQGSITAVAFSRDGKTVATRGSTDNTLRLYEAATGKELRVLGPLPPKNNNNGGNVQVFTFMTGANRTGVAFSPDGKLVASPQMSTSAAPGQFPSPMGMQITLNLWDVSTGKEVQKIVLPNQYGLMSFAFSPDGRTLATENVDQTITVWEVASGKARARFGRPGGNRQQVATTVWMRGGVGFGGFALPSASPTLAFARDGRTLVSRGGQHAVYLWDIATGKEVGQLKGHEGDVTALAFAADGKTLVSGSSDTTLLVWDATSTLPKPRPQLAQLKAGEVEAVWTDLTGADATKAYQGMQKLLMDPVPAIAFLSKHLKPAVAPDPAKLRRWVADLEHKRFAVRQRANRALEKLGELAVPTLHAALKTNPPLETRRRLEQLLEKLTGTMLSNEQLRLARAIEVLERLGTPEARQVLRTLSRGAAGALPTREAHAALERLAR